MNKHKNKTAIKKKGPSKKNEKDEKEREKNKIPGFLKGITEIN